MMNFLKNFGLLLSFLILLNTVYAQNSEQMVRMAKIVVDSTELPNYKSNPPTVYKTSILSQ
ncbi:MAG: hypothetical protein RL596_1789 [Bacteroidota bacterium]|jgi:hypothetical protein